MLFLSPISRNLGKILNLMSKMNFLPQKHISRHITWKFSWFNPWKYDLNFFTEKSKMAAIGHLEFKVPIIFRLGGCPSSNPYTIGHLYWKNGAFITFCPIVMLSTPTMTLDCKIHRKIHTLFAFWKQHLPLHFIA